MENHRADLLRDLGNRTRIPEGHEEDIERYEQAGKIGRWIIRRRDPVVFQHYQRELRRREYLDAQQSIEDAKRSAYANEGQTIIF
jgi:tRNA A22 N-methylase